MRRAKTGVLIVFLVAVIVLGAILRPKTDEYPFLRKFPLTESYTSVTFADGKDTQLHVFTFKATSTEVNSALHPPALDRPFVLQNHMVGVLKQTGKDTWELSVDERAKVEDQ